MKHTKLIVRVAAAVLACLLLATTLVSGLGMRGFAATPSNARIIYILDRNSDGLPAVEIATGEYYYILFRCEIAHDADESDKFIASVEGASIKEVDEDEWNVADNDVDTGNLVLRPSDIVDRYILTGTMRAKYLGDEAYPELVVNINDNEEGNDADKDNVNFDITLTITPSLLNRGNTQDLPDVDDDDPDVDLEGNPPPVSQIVVENMIALDSAGNKIDEITEDTPSFTLEVVFADVGLHNMPVRLLRDRDLDAYVTEAGGFILGSSARGTMSLVTSSDYPRFRARFTDITYSGTGNTLGFTVFYDFYGFFDKNPDPGKGTGTLFSAATEEEDTEEDGAGIKVPKIIISAYSYGEEAIFAGDEFPLDFTVTNTSADLALENIVITMTPAAPEGADKGPGLIVASSSNTIYLPALGPGASQSNSVSFKARPDAEVTSHLVNVRFSYEYQKSEKEGYVAAPELSESIAIPVSQIDRFTVDPIQDAPYAEAGQEAYLTVTFINKGKSPTYNISGTVKIDESVNAPPQHFGNLDPGASDSLDFFLTGSVAGVFEGEVILQYEDDNGTVNEVASPFTMTVEEPWVPDFGPGMEDPGMMEPPPPAGPNVWTIVLCAVGGLAIALPLALTLMKRVKRKGREEFDETV